MATLLAPQDSVNMAQAQWQEMESGKWSNGVMNGQLNNYVVTTTSGLGISVASGKALIQGFLARSDAAVALTAATADPTNPRIDRAVLHADLSAHTLTVQLLTGTPAPSPTPPALTQTSTVWEISLYQVRVNAGATTITSLTDERVYTAPNSAVNKTGDTMTGALSIAKALGGINQALLSLNATDGKTYALVVRVDGKLGVLNVTDGVYVAVFGATAGTIEADVDTTSANQSTFVVKDTKAGGKTWQIVANQDGSISLFDQTDNKIALKLLTSGGVNTDAGAISTDGAGHLTAVGFIGPLTGNASTATSATSASQVPAAGVQAGTLGGSVNLTKITSDGGSVTSDGAGNLAATTLKDGGNRAAVTGAGSTWATQAVIGIGDLAHRPAAGTKGRIYIQTPFS